MICRHGNISDYCSACMRELGAKIYSDIRRSAAASSGLGFPYVYEAAIRQMITDNNPALHFVEKAATRALLRRGL